MADFDANKDNNNEVNSNKKKSKTPMHLLIVGVIILITIAVGLVLQQESGKIASVFAGTNGLPNCSSSDNIALLQSTLNNHPNWVKSVYGFDPSKPYSVSGVFIYKQGDKALKESFCKAMISTDNSTAQPIDVYYTLQNTLNGNNTEIDVINPYNF